MQQRHPLAGNKPGTLHLCSVHPKKIFFKWWRLKDRFGMYMKKSYMILKADTQHEKKKEMDEGYRGAQKEVHLKVSCFF